MDSVLKGHVIRLGNGASARAICPEYYKKTDSAGNDAHAAVENAGEDVIVAGDDFCDSDECRRAVEALKKSGIKCVIAKSFGREFFREAINGGLPVVEASLNGDFEKGVPIEVDFSDGVIKVAGTEKTFRGYPDFILEILDAGGLTPFTLNEVTRK